MEERMRVLITGVAGFLGTHVAEYFTKRGWEVVGIDNLTDYELVRANFDTKKSREHNLKFLESLGVEFHKADCRDVTSNSFKGINFIIHCAAQPAMTIAIEDPAYDASNNVMSVVNMLNIARVQGIPFVNCSSVHVYGNDINNELTEDTTRFVNDIAEFDEGLAILKGDLTPLHVSKRSTELYTQAFAETYGMRTASFRLTGMYGERQFGGMDHGWVANFAIRTIKERPITIFGTDKQVRDILYAEDAARAFEMWFNTGAKGIYNIGGGIDNAISLGECLTELSIINEAHQTIKKEPGRFGDLYYFVCNYKKAKNMFGWKPKIGPTEGLKRISKWIKENEEIL